jgi:hypothetical protein
MQIAAVIAAIQTENPPNGASNSAVSAVQLINGEVGTL